MQERRRHKRLLIELPVTLRYKGSLIPATALNVSCGGMCLSTDNPEVNDAKNVEVIIDLSAAELDISVRGQIVRVTEGNNTNLGIQFTNLYSLGHQAIERFINRRNN